MSDEKTPIQDRSPAQPEQKTNKSSNRNHKGNPFKKDFKGSTPELEGFVFNVHSEQKHKGEYNEVIDRIRAYSTKQFPSCIRQLCSIFDKNVEPTFQKPDITRDYGPTPDDIDRLRFMEDIKEWR